VPLDYNVSSGPFLSFEIRDGPGPELDNTIKGDINNGKTSQILVIIGYLS